MRKHSAALIGSEVVGHRLSTACIDTRDGFEEIGGEWEALSARDERGQLYQSYPWLSTWLRHHEGCRLAIFAARREGRLTAALPLCVHEEGLPSLRLRTLRFVADSDSDYCDALSDPDHPEDLALLWRQVEAQRDWHLMDLRYVPAKGHLATLLPGLESTCRVIHQPQETAPYLPLTDDWLDCISRSHRPEMVRRFRRLQERGAVFEVARNRFQVDEMLGELADLHIQRWQARGETSVFRFPEHCAWLRALCLDLLTSGQLYLCRLSVQGEPVSIGLHFLWGGRLLGHTISFNKDYARYGPVHALWLSAVRDVHERRLATVKDFGRGAEAYKLQWTQQAQLLERILVARRTPVGVSALWWSGTVKTYLWQHARLGTTLRELRRRAALRR